MNIEFTYQQKMGKYEEFKNICLVDTLDHCTPDGHQFDLFAMSVQNTARIKQQNDRKISVIIGNPPYFANQANENENNKSREYLEIDKLIKASYIKFSQAQKTKRYDMYSRFFRWGTDRLGKNGLIVFITNSNFINSREADGFRKVIYKEFSQIYIIDLGGDSRAGDITGNVFNIKVGVAISFLIKKKENSDEQCKIFYHSLSENCIGSEKLQLLKDFKLDQLPFIHIIPDEKGNWINLADTDFDILIPVADKVTKQTKKIDEEKAIFKLFSLGISTNRDEWITDYSFSNLSDKMHFFVDIYENYQNINNNLFTGEVKWSESLKKHYLQQKKRKF